MCTNNRLEKNKWDTEYLLDTLTYINVVIRSVRVNGK